jgi:outer membrane protein TolC
MWHIQSYEFDSSFLYKLNMNKSIGKMTRTILFSSMMFLFYSWNSSGQINVLNERDFIKVLIDNHPIAQRATLEIEIGKQEVIAAKGAFDPIIGGTAYRKIFKGDDYYTKYDAGIRQPLNLLGMDIQGGIEINRGNFLNPERNTPLSGLGYLGLRLPLLQGMAIDQRRTDIELSKLYLEQKQINNLNVLNKLLMNGLELYWNWIRTRKRLGVLNEVLKNNQIVFEGIKVAYFQGDIPAIDTIEAYQQLQRITLQYNSELIQVQNAFNYLKTHLYDTEMRLLNITMDASISEFKDAAIYEPRLIQKLEQKAIFESHPNIAYLRNETKRLSTLLRWERERLKPRLDLQYNFLADTGMSPVEQTFFNDNYQAGLTLQFPLLFRTARAKTEQIKIYTKQNNLELIDEFNILENMAEATRFRLENTRSQVIIAASITSDAKKLYDAELTRFRMGESSVFLVNTRELQYLQAQNALIDLSTEEILQGYLLLFDMGILYSISN